jgi:hypothetical protein
VEILSGCKETNNEIAHEMEMNIKNNLCIGPGVWNGPR